MTPMGQLKFVKLSGCMQDRS